MRYQCHTSAKIPAEVQIARFDGSGGVGETHLIVRPTAPGDIDAQLQWINEAYVEVLAAARQDPHTALLRRFFCSDLSNQAHALAAHPFSSRDATDDPCAVSWVGMPPAPPTKVALWAYHVNDPAGPLHKSRETATLVWRHNGLAHRWTTGLANAQQRSAYDQTRAAFGQYDELLRAHKLSWLTNVIRTWLFVRNIDADYPDVVAARREFFSERGLTPQTHFIASTGIEGAGVDPAAAITLDAYSIEGVRPEQIEFLTAPDHLGPTHLYGVTFERGVAVAYRDRRHVIVSGTASIDPQGQVLHSGDLARQVDRTLENIAALLHAAGAGFRDMSVLIAYVRNADDQAFVLERMRAQCGQVPTAVLVAPVCRPAWLVEIEGMAIVPATRPELPAF